MVVGGRQTDWTEHKDASGQIFYHNRITNESSWEKPNELKSEFEKEERTPWKEYLDDQSRKYYVNSITNETTWNMPEEYQLYLKKMEDHRKKLEEDSETPLEKMLRTVFPDEPAKNKFARLLALERHMLSSWTWDQCISATFEDERSKQLKMAERKQVYQQLVQKLKIYEAEEKKRKEIQMVDDFFDMLDSWSEIDKYTTFREVSEKFDLHPAFLALGNNEKERLRLFSDYKLAKERKARAAAKQEQEKRIDDFKQLMIEAKLSTQTTWKQFVDEFASQPSFQALEAIDRIDAFAHYIGKLERQDDEQLAATRRKNRTISRKAREGFRSLLLERFSAPSHSTLPTVPPTQTFLDAHTTWRSFQPLVLNDPRYQAMLTVSGSTPAELFYDYISDLQDRYAKERRKVKNLAKSLGLRVLLIQTHRDDEHHSAAYDSELVMTYNIDTVPKMDFKIWSQRLRNHVSNIDDATLKHLYHEFGSRELSKAQGRIQKARRKLRELISPLITSDTSTTYENLSERISNSSDVHMLSENDRKVVFETLKEQINNSSASSDVGLNTDVEIGERVQKAKRSRHSIDSKSDSEGEETKDSPSKSRTSSISNKVPKLEEDTTPGSE